MSKSIFILIRNKRALNPNDQSPCETFVTRLTPGRSSTTSDLSWSQEGIISTKVNPIQLKRVPFNIPHRPIFQIDIAGSGDSMHII